jgi:AraC-like DNA-binding protein
MEGEIVCCINNNTRSVSAGEFVLCLSNEVHSIKSEGGSKVWVGVFSEDFIHEFKKYQKGKTGIDFKFRCKKSIHDYLLEHFVKTDLYDIFMIKSCLYALCGEYLRQIPMKKIDDKHASVMNDVIEFVENHYKNPLTLENVAESLGYEYCYFSKMFNRLFSMSFNDYLSIYRFNEASKMLTETELPVTQIAYESGFQSVRNFNHTFKRIAGVCPREYRTKRDDINQRLH